MLQEDVSDLTLLTNADFGINDRLFRFLLTSGRSEATLVA